jgi:creatinine amidohydrolase
MAGELPSVWINELTWQEIEAYLGQNDIVLVPIGSTEQHGPAGPLGLDTYVAISLAEDAAKAAGVLAAPPLWYGESTHHMGFAGTITLQVETMIAVVKDICRSLAKHGFRKIVLINGHKGSNLPALNAAAKSLHEFELPDVMLVVVDPLHIGKGIAGDLKEHTEHHCGELEISELWYRYPNLLRTDRLTDEEVDLREVLSPFATYDLFGKLGDTVEIPWNSREQREIVPTGSFSISRDASPEKGRRYHEYMVNNLTRLITWLREYRGPIGRG